MKTLIVGAGHLAKFWIREAKQQAFASDITAVTRSPSRHEELDRLGVHTSLADSDWGTGFHTVLVMVPPSSVERPLELLSKAEKTLIQGGKLWLVSSTGVYKERSGAWVDELSEVDTSHPLVEWENFCLIRGFGVVRLAGLYDRDRGPHKVYQRFEERPGFGGEFVNLIHTADAARLLLACVEEGTSSLRVGCDGQPLTRNELASEAARLVPGSLPCRFTSANGFPGKRVRSRNPFPLKHSSFRAWVDEELSASIKE